MFSDNLRRRRLELGLSQNELAEKVGYRSRSSIAKLEAGVCDIPQKKLGLLACALNTTLEALITDDSSTGIGVESQVEIKDKRRIIALIQAGGKSTRNMLSIPSQFVVIDGKPVIVYVMEAYEKHPQIDEINVVCLSGWEKTLESYAKQYHISKLKRIITGGTTIIDSVKKGITDLKKDGLEDDIVILQEATRPMITSSMISKIISSYYEFGNSVLVRPMSEYVQIELNGNISKVCNRETLFSLESPEIYSATTLLSILDSQIDKLLDDGSCCAVMMARIGKPLHYCGSSSVNIKIVRQEDIYYFKVLKSLIL